MAAQIDLEQIITPLVSSIRTVFQPSASRCESFGGVIQAVGSLRYEPAALLERPWLQEAKAESDPRRVIELWTANGRNILTRGGPIMRVVGDAAVVDPE